MNWLLLIGVTLVGVLLLFAVLRMRGRDTRPERLPSWLPIAGLGLAGAFFALSVVSGSWTSAVLFGLNMLVFSMLLGVARRPDGG